MSLLQDIQNAAIDGNVPISTLLRKCAVLAARLNNKELETWVADELNGYGSTETVPEYRVLGAVATGSLAGPFNSGYRNITIPPMVLPEGMRDFGKVVRLQRPIASLETLAKKHTGFVTFPWPGDLIAYMQSDEGTSSRVVSCSMTHGKMSRRHPSTGLSIR